MLDAASSMDRTGGQVLIDQLEIHGARHVFCVPGESYLAALDAMHDSKLELTICRQEGGAAMMAEAYGKLTGQPGICFVTRGPGATNASPGLHIAAQDSTPMILFVGQVGRDMKEREAFQELDYKAVFGTIAKWVVDIENAARIPELVARAFNVAMSGRPGPVVVALPEDMLTDMVRCVDALPVKAPTEARPAPQDMATLKTMLAEAKRPVLIVGGSRWNDEAVKQIEGFAARFELPVMASFRRQPLFPASNKNYVGDIGVGANPALVEAIKRSDLVLLLGTRFSESPSQGYTVLDIPRPLQTIVHVYPEAEELGRVYQADLALNVAPQGFAAACAEISPDAAPGRAGYVAELRAAYEAWSGKVTEVPGAVNLGTIVRALNDTLPPNAILTNGAGNYATWINRFYRFEQMGTLLAPISGSMGYGIPAAVGALRADPTRPVIAFAGDGCFLMNGQEFATAVQYNLPLIVVVADNGMYGTIRMHQERHYPDRVTATALKNPDFAAYAVAFGGHGERVERTEDFMPAYERAVKSGKPAILHCIVDPEALTAARSLSDIRAAGRAARKVK